MLNSKFDITNELDLPLTQAFFLLNLDALDHLNQIQKLRATENPSNKAEEIKDDYDSICYIAGLHPIASNVIKNMINIEVITERHVLMARQNYEQHEPLNVLFSMYDDVYKQPEDDSQYILEYLLMNALNTARVNLSLSYNEASDKNTLKASIPAITRGLGLTLDLMKTAYDECLVHPAYEMGSVLETTLDINKRVYFSKANNDINQLSNLRIIKQPSIDYFSNFNLELFEKNETIIIPKTEEWQQVRRDARLAYHYTDLDLDSTSNSNPDSKFKFN